jgi:hypothetical protein
MSMVKKYDALEKVLYWSMLFAIAVFVALLLLDLIIRPWLPEEVAYILGFAMFYLFASRLLFGYGYLSVYLDKVAKAEATDVDKQHAYMRSGAHKHGLIEQLTYYGIATIWLDRYEPYRYAYMAVYLLLAILMIVLNLSLVSGLTTGSILEGVFWGATTVSLFVLAADMLVRWQYARAVVEPTYQVLVPGLNLQGKAQEELISERVCPDPDDLCEVRLDKSDNKQS